MSWGGEGGGWLLLYNKLSSDIVKGILLYDKLSSDIVKGIVTL